MLLADNDEPLVLQDGTKINPATGEVIRTRSNYFVEVPSNTQAVREVTRVRRTLAELPVAPKQMNLMSVVFCYTTFGLTDTDIAYATNLTTKQITTLKQTPEYASVSKMMLAAIAEGDVDDVRSLLSKHARGAAQRMIDLADSENESIAQKASADILDRAGLRPVDVVNHSINMQGGLTIEVYERKKDAPTLELEAE